MTMSHWQVKDKSFCNMQVLQVFNESISRLCNKSHTFMQELAQVFAEKGK